jgi:hypothetical protein
MTTSVDEQMVMSTVNDNTIIMPVALLQEHWSMRCSRAA